MRRALAILLIVAMLAPSLHNMRCGVEGCAVTIEGQAIGKAIDAGRYDQAPPKTTNTPVSLTAIVLRRVPSSCVKILRILRQKPIIKSESPRHSEMWTGDVSSMRI